MRGGFRKLMPIDSDLADEELIEQTHVQRQAFNEHFRVHGCAETAHAYAEAVASLPRLQPLPAIDDEAAPGSDVGDAA